VYGTPCWTAANDLSYDKVDDGLDLRKAAFECMYTLLDSCVDRLDIFEFLAHVQDGLKVKIKSICGLQSLFLGKSSFLCY
jgi:TATA-binding protein interacting (TIP20)